MAKSRNRTTSAGVELLERRALLSAVTQVFIIDPTRSTATGSGTLTYSAAVDANGDPSGTATNTSQLMPVYDESFTNNAVGSITIRKTDSTIKFLNADIAGENTAGNAYTFGVPANFAGSFSISEQTPTGTDTGKLYASISDLAAGLQSGPLALTNGSFSNAGETLPIITGVLGISISATENGVAQAPLTSFSLLSSFTTNVANTSQLSSTLTTDANGVETLTIQASGSFTESLGSLSATLQLTGLMVATYTPPAVSPVVTASVANHVLTVEGTANGDFINIHQTGSMITIVSGGTTVGTFDATGLTQITVLGNAGPDTIKTASNVTVPTFISGGGGSDTLTAGNTGATLDGGAGHDSLVALTTGDMLSGGASGDSLIGNAANDTLAGGKGFDSLSSLSGNDSLIGGVGNDTLFSGNSQGDSLDGGTGTNTTVTQNSITPAVVRAHASAVAEGTQDNASQQVLGNDALGNWFESKLETPSLLE